MIINLTVSSANWRPFRLGPNVLKKSIYTCTCPCLCSCTDSMGVVMQLHVRSMARMLKAQRIMDRACHPGGPNWNYCPGTLSCSQVSVSYSDIGHQWMKSCRWNLWVSDLQMSCRDLTTWQGNVTMMTSSFPPDWPFVRGISWWPVDYPHKGQCCGALIFSLICAWTNGWANNRDAGETASRSLWRHCNVPW